MRIRQALPEDMAAVAELSRVLAAHVNDLDPGFDYSILVDCAFGLDRWFECLAAEEANCIVGFALFCRRFEAHTRQKRLWLGDLCVAKDKRGDGIGRSLIAAVQTRAAELGCTAIDLELAHGNDLARSFYENVNAVICDGIEPWRILT
jgi:ribosomal protein S18 acetylase RimI-like enzyme